MSDVKPYFVTCWTDANGEQRVTSPRRYGQKYHDDLVVRCSGPRPEDRTQPDIELFRLAWNELRGYMLGPIKFPTTQIVMDRLAAAIVAAGGAVPE